MVGARRGSRRCRLGRRSKWQGLLPRETFVAAPPTHRSQARGAEMGLAACRQADWSD